MSQPSTPPTSPDRGGAGTNDWYAALARWVIRRRWLVLCGSLVLTAGLALEIARDIKIEASVESFLASDSDAFRSLEDLRDDFGRDSLFMVIAEGDVFSLPFLERVRALHDELAAIDLPLETLGQRRGMSEPDSPQANATPANADDDGHGAVANDTFDFGGDSDWGDEAGGSVVEEVTSIINARQTRSIDGALQVGGFLDQWPTEPELPALRRAALSEPSLVGRIVGHGGRHTALLIRTDFMSEADSNRVDAEIRRIVAAHGGPGFELHVAGLPALTARVLELMLGDLRTMAAVGLAMLLLIMAFTFRHPIGVIGPLLVVVQAVVWCFGAVTLSGRPVTMISNILPVFIVCVSVGDSVHILSVYRDARRAGYDNETAIVHAVGTTGVPVAFTTLTTCIGLLSFQLASVDAIQDMGLFGALGVAAALFHSVVFLPAVLTFNRTSLLGVKTGSADAPPDALDRFLGFCNGLSRPKRGASRPWLRRHVTLAAGALLSVLALGLATTLTVYHNPITWIPQGYPIRDAFDLVDKELSGAADMTLLIEAPTGRTVRDKALVDRLEKLEAHVAAYEHPMRGAIVNHIISMLDVLRETNRALHGADQAFFRVPDTPRGVVDTLTLFENAGPDELTRLATVDLRRTIMVARLPWLDASSYRPLVEHVRRGIDEYIGDAAVVNPTGSALSLVSIVDSLLTDLIRSFGTAFVVITLLMIALLRDLRLGLIAMVPNLLPVAIVLGFMGAAGIPIDLNNILLGSIAIGIAVDDTIHFLHQFKRHMQAGDDVETAIAQSFRHAGRAIVITSAILVAGFSVFATAEMYNVARFGLLIALTLLSALLVDVMFTPALLRTFYRQPKTTRTHAPGDAHAEQT